MKVTMRKTEETSGLFKKTTEYSLHVGVVLTPEEVDAIRKAGIGDHLLVEYSYKGLDLNYQVKSVVYGSEKGSEFRFVSSDAVSRNAMEQRVKDGLKALKSQIDAQLSAGPATQSFEL